MSIGAKYLTAKERNEQPKIQKKKNIVPTNIQTDRKKKESLQIVTNMIF